MMLLDAHASQYIEALGCLERILDEEPNNPIAIGERAFCLTQLNRYDEALQAYQTALDSFNISLHRNYDLQDRKPSQTLE